MLKEGESSFFEGVPTGTHFSGGYTHTMQKWPTLTGLSMLLKNKKEMKLEGGHLGGNQGKRERETGSRYYYLHMYDILNQSINQSIKTIQTAWKLELQMLMYKLLR